MTALGDHPPRSTQTLVLLVSRFSFSSRALPQVPAFNASQLKASECSLQERYDLCRSVADECIQVFMGQLDERIFSV